MFERFPNSDGIVPVIYCSKTCKINNWPNLPISVGMVPRTSMPVKSIAKTLERPPISVGIVPETLGLGKRELRREQSTSKSHTFQQ